MATDLPRDLTAGRVKSEFVANIQDNQHKQASLDRLASEGG